MRWDAPAIASFARQGGIPEHEIATAIALALATSGGIATYDHVAGIPGAGRYVGLWGIDTDRWPEYADADLHVPQMNAWAAGDLYEHAGGWEWSPVFVAGTHRPHLHDAGVARSRVMDAQPVTLAFTPLVNNDRLHELRRDLTDIARQPRLLR